MRRTLSILTLALALLPVAATAQVVNGDFEAGGTGWSTSIPAQWSITFPPAGGNPDGHALIQSPFGNSGGEGCIAQTFLCGTDPQGPCIITLDYRHRSIDASPLTGRVRIFIDDTLVHTSPPSNLQDWTTVTFTAPCGEHTIRLCLQVDAGNNGWQAAFDNVRAICDIPIGAERTTWGLIKRLYD
jgi:hypothetical protein